MDTKLCPRCNRILPLSEFHKDKSRSSGVYSYCKKCNYENSRKYIEKKPDYYANYGKRYRIDHLEELRKYGREYSHKRYKNNKATYRRYVRTRRARKRGNEYPSKGDISKRINNCGNKCIYCGGKYEHIDHVQPVSKGGLDNIHNLVPSCATCNLSKNNRDWLEWYREQPFFDDNKAEFIKSLLS